MSERAPAPAPWEFDPTSALIGAVAAFVLVGLIYYFRDTLRQSRETITTQVSQVSQQLQANAEERYRELVNAIYGGKTEVPIEAHVRYRDGRTGTIKTTISIKSVEGVD